MTRSRPNTNPSSDALPPVEQFRLLLDYQCQLPESLDSLLRLARSPCPQAAQRARHELLAHLHITPPPPDQPLRRPRSLSPSLRYAILWLNHILITFGPRPVRVIARNAANQCISPHALCATRRYLRVTALKTSSQGWVWFLPHHILLLQSGVPLLEIQTSPDQQSAPDAPQTVPGVTP